ncbi:MAG: hypothetical protein NWQ62_07175 [Cyanobium sp. MAG_102]|nr:hypothetical protein [Cyanobium sp. MAG_255]MDP4737985.1 hypothetical protein [Cyanobium sp. MAG_216]MDP4831568.1 hypothetical protein [Cyanobium sp. MAG_185]MDP4948048.1 hypothetical protein [Cyanobium sp. MAG_102]
MNLFHGIPKDTLSDLAKIGLPFCNNRSRGGGQAKANAGHPQAGIAGIADELFTGIDIQAHLTGSQSGPRPGLEMGLQPNQAVHAGRQQTKALPDLDQGQVGSGGTKGDREA